MSDAAMMRVSSDEQRKKETIQMQREQIERYALKHDIAIADWYADDGVSGTIPIEQRPEGRRLIADARAGRIKRLFIYRFDRLGRDDLGLVALQAITMLHDQCGVEIVAVSTPHIDIKTPHGRFMVQIECAVSGYERSTIIERSIDGNHRIARAGGWLGGKPPFGYRLSGNGSAARLVPSDLVIPHVGLSEADVVREMYRLVVEENRPCQFVADWLNRLKVPTVFAREGVRVNGQEARGVWSLNRVRNMITSTTYRGIQTYAKSSKRGAEPIGREVPPLVSPERWDAAQRGLIERRNYATKNGKHPYLFRGLIKCGDCGRSYTGQYQPWRAGKGGPYTYYVCTGKSAARPAAKVPTKCANINGDKLEARVWTDLEAWSSNPQLFVDRVLAQMSADMDDLIAINAEIKQAERALADAGRERDGLLTFWRKGRITEAALDKQLDAIDNEERAATERVEALRVRARAAQESTDKTQAVFPILIDLFAHIESADTFEKKRRVVESSIERIDVRTVDGVATPDITYRFSRLDPPAYYPEHQKDGDDEESGYWGDTFAGNRSCRNPVTLTVTYAPRGRKSA